MPANEHVDVDRELEQWKAERRIGKRSFREPWRSLAIVAGIGFGLSSWILPDSVANIAEAITSGLAVASLLAGFQKPAQAQGPTTSATGESGVPRSDEAAAERSARSSI